MKEPENIVAKWTHWLSNRRCESSMGKALIFERGGRIEERASNRAIALSELCSAVTTATRIRFEWNVECGEPLSNGRNQPLWARRVYAPKEHSDVREIARSQGLVYKAGKDNEGMRSANFIDRSRPGGSGRSTHDIPDNNGEEERTCGHGGFWDSGWTGYCP